jgi:hypothetical protein
MHGLFAAPLSVSPLTDASGHCQKHITDGLLVLQHHQAGNAAGTEQQLT